MAATLLRHRRVARHAAPRVTRADLPESTGIVVSAAVGAAMWGALVALLIYGPVWLKGVWE